MSEPFARGATCRRGPALGHEAEHLSVGTRKTPLAHLARERYRTIASLSHALLDETGRSPTTSQGSYAGDRTLNDPGRDYAARTAAGNAAVEALRHEGYSGRLTMLSADDTLSCDHPNLSKIYLAGRASEESTLLRPAEFYEEHEIQLRMRLEHASRRAILQGRHVQLVDGSSYAFDTLLLVTGAEPVHLDMPGADLPHVISCCLV